MNGYAGSPPPPISILSVDLLEIAFDELVKPVDTFSVSICHYPRPGYSSLQTVSPYHAVTLSHVCRLWRDVAFGMGRLWSKVLINHREMALHYLKRSSQAPLYLFFVSKLGPVLNFGWLSPHSPRFHGLVLPELGVEEVEGLVKAMPNDLPLLEAFSVSQAGLRIDPPFRNLDWKFRAPNLRFFTLRCDFNFKLEHFLSFLKETPLLHTVKLTNAGFVPPEEGLPLGVVDLRHVQDWELENVFGFVDFLDRLDISPRNFSLFGDIINLNEPLTPATMGCLARTLTKHTHLTIEVFGQVTIQPSTRSASCEICHVPSSDNFLPLFLERIGSIIPWSSLTYLELTSQDEELITPMDVWDDLSPVWSRVLSALVNVETICIFASGFRHLSVVLRALCERGLLLDVVNCPRLSTLELQYFDFSRDGEDEDTTELELCSVLGFTYRRKVLGLPLRSLIFLACDYVSTGILRDIKLNVEIVDVRQ